MASWGIAEWYGEDILTMTPERREEFARRALDAHAEGLKDAPQPACPFLSSVRPNAVCNKPGGVCSIRKYLRDVNGRAVAADHQPATMCPNRFLEHRTEKPLFAELAERLFGETQGAAVIKEIPFLEKEVVDGGKRGAKAGRIDWIIVPRPGQADESTDLAWVAVETQAVYFSGDAIWPDIEAYVTNPNRVHMPAGVRRPDFRSSGAKRLHPQLAAKAPVMNRWGKKVVVVVDRAFFNEMGALLEADDFDNAEVVWVITRFNDQMVMELEYHFYAELSASLGALQAAKPVIRTEYEAMLRDAVKKRRPGKVFDA